MAILAIVAIGVGALWTRSRAALRQSAAEVESVRSTLSLLFDSPTVGIIGGDRKARCTDVNRAAAEILGRNKQELMGAPIGEVFATAESTKPFSLEVAAPGERPVVRDAVLRRPDGSTVPVEYSVAPFSRISGLAGVVVTFTDATPRRRLEAQLEQANRVESLGRLAANMAHEFNNVLMGIQPFAELMTRNISAEKREQAAKHIQTAVRRGKNVAGDILRFTRPLDPVRSAIDVEEFLGSFVTEALRVIGNAPEIRIDVEGRLFVDGDRNQLHQTLTNLALNARDAMPGGGQIVIRATRERGSARFSFGVVEQPDRFVHLAVADDGVGIPADIIGHVFEPMFTTKKSGTGLGLSIVHQIVKRHGGQIFVESVVGKGATFHLFLPAAEGAEETLPASGGEAKTAPRLKVLLVEDEPTVAEGIAELLRLENMSVDVVATGADAVDAMIRSRADVVILDIGLPDIDGREVYEQILARRPAMPVIFSTGHAEPSRFEEVLQRPATRMLLKPYDSETLVGAIREITSPSTSRTASTG